MGSYARLDVSWIASFHFSRLSTGHSDRAICDLLAAHLLVEWLIAALLPSFPISRLNLCELDVNTLLVEFFRPLVGNQAALHCWRVSRCVSPWNP